MLNNQPKKVYRYQSFNSKTVEALCNDQLFFSDPASFNDPQECNPFVESDSDIETLKHILTKLISERVKKEIITSLKKSKLKGNGAIKHAKKHSNIAVKRKLADIRYHSTNPDHQCSQEEAELWLLTNEIQRELQKQYNRGICCFSSSYKNPLLWSHYGDQHYGLCVGYSRDRDPEPELHKVKYGGNRILQTSLIADAIINNKPKSQELLDRKSLLSKASQWQYEREWRIFGQRGLQDSPLKMVEITFGLRCPYPVMHSVIKALENREDSLKFFQINEIRNNFQLKREPVDIDEMQFYLPHTACSALEMGFTAIDES